MHYRTLISILFVLGVAILGASMRPSAAAPANQLYLPLMSCPLCTRNGVPLPPPPDLDEVQPVRRELLALVNAARTEAGCPAAAEDPLIMRVTQEWSIYMATNRVYHHASPDWYIERGAYYAYVENIGPATTAQRQFEMWWLSINHRDNMLFCDLPDVDYVMGVGYYEGNWTFSLGWHWHER
jgi:uncharacterized protein YkwD